MIGLSRFKRWALMATFAVIAVATFSLLPADAASAGTIEGGRYTVKVGGENNIPLEDDNTDITLNPAVGGLTYTVNDGNIRIPNVPAGTYTVTINFRVDQSMCQRNWMTRLAGTFVGPLAAMCRFTGVGQTHFGLQKVFTNVVVTDAGVTRLNPASGSLGNALKTDANGNPVIDCAGKGILMSFVVCPIIENVLGIMDWIIENFIQPYLAINPLVVTFDDGRTSEIYTVWNNIRNFANIAFILAFFAIIFSQATSIGITNYGVKRLLPRLILIGVATNISFFICAFLVDVFNVLGAGAASLLVVGITGEGSLTLDPSLSTGFTIGLVAVTAAAPGLIAVASAAIIFGMFVFLFVGAIILILAGVAIIVRQIVIVVFVMISPIVFVAGLFPNTQKYLGRWFASFIQILLVYPLFMIIVAGGKIISVIFMRMGG